MTGLTWVSWSIFIIKAMSFSDLTRNPSRRDFLKLLGLGFAASILPQGVSSSSFTKDQLFGRVTRNGVAVYPSPSLISEKVKHVYLDEVFPVKEIAIDDKNGQNRLWYELGEIGFAPASFIQPVRRVNQVSNGHIPEEGRLGEISVPYIDAYDKVRGTRVVYRFYYAATFWVQERLRDDWGVPWYRVLDDRSNRSYFVRAYAVRLVDEDELQPISPDVDPDTKWLLVDLSQQTVRAYEDKREVFMAKISSGTINSEGYYYTPKGQFRTYIKRPCRHMASPASDRFSGFDLPGVPWVSYFTGDGIAFHGTYWHNNFGVPMSHGCINMTPQAAKWIYCWTLPCVPSNQYILEDPNATRVKIV